MRGPVQVHRPHRGTGLAIDAGDRPHRRCFRRAVVGGTVGSDGECRVGLGDRKGVRPSQRQRVVAVCSEGAQGVGIRATRHSFARSTPQSSTGDGGRSGVCVLQSRDGVGKGRVRRSVNLRLTRGGSDRQGGLVHDQGSGRGVGAAASGCIQQ